MTKVELQSELDALKSANVETVVKPVETIKTGVSTLVEFRYTKDGLIAFKLEHGQSGIIANREVLSFSDLMSMKGQKVQIGWEHIGTKTDKSGKVWDRYVIGFRM